MKHFINIFVTLILTGFAVGISYLQLMTPDGAWCLLFIPLIVMMILWGVKLDNDYKNEN